MRVGDPWAQRLLEVLRDVQEGVTKHTQVVFREETSQGKPDQE
jgi:hypothetical protein